MQAAIEGLRAKPGCHCGQGVSVNGAMTELLGDTALWTRFGTTAVSSLVSGLLGDSMSRRRSTPGFHRQSALLGGGELGEVVPQVASALMGASRAGPLWTVSEASVQSLVSGCLPAAGDR